MEPDPLVSVGALHALAYCERLFYLEEVERIRVADASVYAGRRAHLEQTPESDEGAFSRLALESDGVGIRGVADMLRRRDGKLIPYEHKRGRSAGKKGAREAWRTDRVQVGAYAMLAEEAYGQSINEARVRYHADNVVIRVPIDDELRDGVRAAVARARELRQQVDRPPVAENDRLCTRCSLAAVCLPEEARLGHDADFRPIRLLPQHVDRATLHVDEHGARVSRQGDQLVVVHRESKTRFPVKTIGQVVLHGLCQITTQALRLCVDHDVQVHWLTFGGSVVGSLAPGGASAQRHIRQFRALSDEAKCLELGRRLVQAKVSAQLRFLLRSTRGRARPDRVKESVSLLRQMLRRMSKCEDRSALLGVEGSAAAAYFECMPHLLGGNDERLTWVRRTRRPPRDRVSAVLSYGYGMLYRTCVGAIVGVGLHPGFGFFHQPRSAAYTLALDIMELFRVSVVDMTIVAALNRSTFDATDDFVEGPARVDLAPSGRKKVIAAFERRLRDTWKHPVVGYSLSYARLIELEVRLLEKEWMGEGGTFARMRLR